MDGKTRSFCQDRLGINPKELSSINKKPGRFLAGGSGNSLVPPGGSPPPSPHADGGGGGGGGGSRGVDGKPPTDAPPERGTGRGSSSRSSSGRVLKSSSGSITDLVSTPSLRATSSTGKGPDKSPLQPAATDSSRSSGQARGGGGGGGGGGGPQLGGADQARLEGQVGELSAKLLALDGKIERQMGGIEAALAKQGAMLEAMLASAQKPPQQQQTDEAAAAAAAAAGAAAP